MLIFLSEANIPNNLFQALKGQESQCARGPLQLEKLLEDTRVKVVVWVLTPNGVKLAKDHLKILNQHPKVGVVLVKDGVWEVVQWQKQLQTLIKISDVLETSEIVQTVTELNSAGAPEVNRQNKMEFIKLFRRQRGQRKQQKHTGVKTGQSVAWDPVATEEKQELSKAYKPTWWQNFINNLRQF